MIIKPDYNQSIINLMSSIQQALGIPSPYNELDILGHQKLLKNKNIILFVIDGLGYNYLLNAGKNSLMSKNLRKKLTSVFLATTATAITSFITGVAPNQHAITGWRMYLKEIGMATELIQFTTRSGKIPLDKYGLEIKDFFDTKNIFTRTKIDSYIIYPENYAHSQFSSAITKGATLYTFKNLQGLFSQIQRATKISNRRKYIYAYWQAFDAVCHKYGTRSKKTLEHFIEIDRYLGKFINLMDKIDAALIITADHGLIDFNQSEIIELDDHPELTKMMIAPLCGEARVAYCYIKPDRTKEFEHYIKQYLNNFCWLYKSHELVKDGWFGLFKEDNKFLDRIGDYVLIMKKNYIIQDQIPGEPAMASQFKACHGGVSQEEMFVPLIILTKNTSST
ncbi:MAG: alkaline phosphatase family protein [bacterium]